MRRTRFLLVIPALLALLGSGRSAMADSTLGVEPNCFNWGGGVAACTPSVTGGTGTYVSYRWTFKDVYFGQTTYTYSSTSTDPWMQQSCRIGGKVTVTVTVTDSNGETGTGTHTITCSWWAD